MLRHRRRHHRFMLSNFFLIPSDSMDAVSSTTTTLIEMSSLSFFKAASVDHRLQHCTREIILEWNSSLTTTSNECSFKVVPMYLPTSNLCSFKVVPMSLPTFNQSWSRVKFIYLHCFRFYFNDNCLIMLSSTLKKQSMTLGSSVTGRWSKRLHPMFPKVA